MVRADTSRTADRRGPSGESKLGTVVGKRLLFPRVVLALIVLAASSGCSPGPAAPRSGPAVSPTRPAAIGTADPLPTAIPSAAPTPVDEASTPLPEPPAVAPDPPAFDRSALSIDDPASLWVVANKTRSLNPVDWTPSDLVTVPVKWQNPPRLRMAAGEALVAMSAAVAGEGAGEVQVQSAWRSYSVQVDVYNGWVARLGQGQADIQSARAGFSEHQTGLAVDLSPVPLSCALSACFGTTPQGQWLAANSWRFGYVLRYPAGKEAVTGFMYEPWHFRFVGAELATRMRDTGSTTLEEFFGLPAAPNYTS